MFQALRKLVPLEEREAELTHEQAAEATALAKQTLARNKNCCIRI